MGWWRSPWKLRRFARLIKTYGRFGCFPSNFNETPRKESGSSVGESPSLIFRHTRKRTRFKYSQRGHFHFRPLPVSRNIIVGNCPRAKRLRISRSMTEFRSYRRLVPCVYFQWARGKHSKRCQTLDSTELNFKTCKFHVINSHGTFDALFLFLCSGNMAGILHRKRNSAHLYDITNIVNELLIN